MIKTEDITYGAGEAYKRSGLVLSADKGYLLESRLAPLARAEGFPSIEALIAAARRESSDRLLWAITEALATHETFFFRDNTPFDLFKQEILPVLSRARGNTATIRIWCAACSSGQEPYSLAITACESQAEQEADMAEDQMEMQAEQSAAEAGNDEAALGMTEAPGRFQ